MSSREDGSPSMATEHNLVPVLSRFLVLALDIQPPQVALIERYLAHITTEEGPTLQRLLEHPDRPGDIITPDEINALDQEGQMALLNFICGPEPSSDTAVAESMEIEMDEDEAVESYAPSKQGPSAGETTNDLISGDEMEMDEAPEHQPTLPTLNSGTRSGGTTDGDRKRKRDLEDDV
ncbi:uncharacterized protein BDZ99DRAFT_167205 [Mytilinidion resinicola]|uniref:Uncharacterized protein n=1 Tax=Mytilinidion resinicola TaxID=574789 RepID=A0A6A6Y5T0_9PEZI|nr:uncharacterized protein BDZ99DRAFT_167205 [Mytilinidion resinicola]KAF2803585.1 hypothetical protein BDZ99DRAFT_167205 [Mytilinidion resinicola]